MKNTFYKYILFSIFFFLTYFCDGQVKKDFLLGNQQFVGNKAVSSDELQSILPQKSNKKFLRTLPLKLWIYQKGQAKHLKDLESKKYESKINEANQAFIEKSKNLSEKSKKYKKLKEKRDNLILKLDAKIKEGNWRMTKLGEAPVYYSAIETKKNVENIQKYLFNKGFFNAVVSSVADTNQQKSVNIRYFISEKNRYKIKLIKKSIDDSEIAKLLDLNQIESKLIENQFFDENNLNSERIRIENLLRNNGFYTFNRNQIKYKVQYLPTDPENVVNINLLIAPLNGNSKEIAYPIGNVEFIVDASESLEQNTVFKVDTIVNKGIKYIFVGQPFSTKFLHKKIFLRPGELFSLQNQYETQKALQNLDQFKFANPSFDTLNNKLNVKIYTLPLEKYQFTGEGGMNVFLGTPGPFVNATLKIRNIFGGLESLENSIRVGYEGQSGIVNKRSFDAGFNSLINIPQIFLPWSFSKLDKYNPRSQLGLGFNYADRYDYKRLNFKLAANYSWQQSQKNQFNFSLVDLNLINTPYLREGFEAILDSLKNQGNNLKESFGKSFVSSLSGSYVYNDNFLGQSQKGKYLRLYAEFGGNLLNFSSNGELGFVNDILGNNLNYFKFVRLLADYRKFIPVGAKQTNLFAFRLNTGLAISYNKDSEVLPYEKYLFAGGSYSLRAWEPRRLGLNKNIAQNNSNSELNYNQEQPGNLLIESSLEYRFPIVKMYGQLNGAWFLDMGNVWSIKKAGVVDKESDFKFKNLFNQLAVGTGFGLRYDFTYFVIRLDAAAKVIEPLLGAKKYVFDDFFSKNKDQNLKLNWNIGIGYPF